MKATFSAASVLTMVAALASVASAQTYAVPSGYGYGYGGNAYGSYGHHASTYEEGVLRGYAASAQGRGQANYLHSLAAVNYQEAYSRSIQNSQKATETYFYNKQTNKAAREAQRSPRLTTEQYVALAKKDAPARLSDRQYDRSFGRLNWPAALAGDQFAAERNELDLAFRLRTPGDAGASSEFYGQVRQLTASLEAKLRSQIDVLDSTQYMTAKKFLLSLSHEATQPAVVAALAAN